MLSQELSSAFLLRAAEELNGRTFLDHSAAIHEDNAIGDFAGKGDFMGDKDHCPAFLRQFLDNRQNFTYQLRVECGRGFIEKQQLRLLGKSAGDGNTLLLATGESMGHIIGFLCQMDLREQFADQPVRFAPF